MSGASAQSKTQRVKSTLHGGFLHLKVTSWTFFHYDDGEETIQYFDPNLFEFS